jgi:hypothetical protein
LVARANKDFDHQHLLRSGFRQTRIVEIDFQVGLFKTKKRWNMSSSEYPALTLASCMAREIAFFPSAALPAFIVTVNNGMRVSQ